MHCVSDYPTQIKDLNMKFINTIKKISPSVGFSDHSIGYEASMAAVVLKFAYSRRKMTIIKSTE